MKDNAGVIMLAIAILVVGVLQFSKDGVTVQVASEDGQVQVVERVGAAPGPDVYQDMRFHNEVSLRENTVSQASTTFTMLAEQSGSTFYVSGTGTVATLPSVQEGLTVRFVSTDVTIANYVIDSAEGDNIEGTLQVNAADVACAGEDQLNIVFGSDTAGDYVELRSDGTSWYIGDSVVAGAGGVTCTDPS